jgi:hypothetical protein
MADITIDPSSYGRALTEREILSSRLQRPILKTEMDNATIVTQSGSVAFNPQCLNIVTANDFRTRFIVNEGTTDVVTNALPPIDYRSPLFSEEDNRFDIKTKIYMPLSRALKHHGMTSSHDCNGVIPQGAADTSIVSTNDLETRVVFEEKSESLLQGLLSGVKMSFPEMCKAGRSNFLHGKAMKTTTARFACPLILAQLLGYMAAETTAYGVIITSGRAYFVWVTYEGKGQIETNIDAQPAQKKAKQENSETPTIHMTEAIMIDDEHFLRVLFNFILQTKPEAGPINGVRVAQLLTTPSSKGGLTKGDPQVYQPSPKGQSKSNNSSKTTAATTPFNLASSTLINRFSVIPDFKATTTLTNTLGREKVGRVVATEWYGVSAVVKTFARNETNGLEERSHERHLFESEVEAYEIAGRAGLWGVAVPKPLFAAMDASVCALCLTAGNPMPLDPEEWSCSDLRQALKNVRLLLEAGIELSDIKPANFISMVGVSSSNGGGEDTRVMAIDLEDSFLVVGGESQDFELPRWMLRGSSSRTVSP